MVIHSLVLEPWGIDWGRAVIGALACIFGALALSAPVRLARIMQIVNRNTPGELLPTNNPEKVASSRWLRVQMQLGGAVILGFGLAFLGLVRDILGLFAAFLVCLGVTLCFAPSGALVLFSWSVRVDKSAVIRHRISLWIVGVASAATGIWVLAHRR
jgi:hypothetical protein